MQLHTFRPFPALFVIGREAIISESDFSHSFSLQLFLSAGSIAVSFPASTDIPLLLDDAELSRNHRQTLPGSSPVFSNGIDSNGLRRLYTQARRVQDMAVQDDWEFFLDNLRTGSEQLPILMEDPESRLGWRLLTKSDVNTLRQILDHQTSESDAVRVNFQSL